ncbi:MAG: hypothetical protein ACHREM_03530 [Polyangiales bacterium]
MPTATVRIAALLLLATACRAPQSFPAPIVAPPIARPPVAVATHETVAAPAPPACADEPKAFFDDPWRHAADRASSPAGTVDRALDAIAVIADTVEEGTPTGSVVDVGARRQASARAGARRLRRRTGRTYASIVTIVAARD